jgi:hypothetical protein
MHRNLTARLILLYPGISLAVALALALNAGCSGPVVLEAIEAPAGFIGVRAYGRASQVAIQNGSPQMMQTTCRAAAESAAQAQAMPLGTGFVKIRGSAVSFSAELRGAGRTPNLRLYFCNFQDPDCECLYGIPLAEEEARVLGADFPARDGFIDESTAAVLQSPGKPLPGGESLRNRATCIQAAQLNALGILAFRMAAQSGHSGDLDIQIPAPRFRTGRCVAPSNAWSSCSCEVMLHAPGLQSELGAAVAGG